MNLSQENKIALSTHNAKLRKRKEPGKDELKEKKEDIKEIAKAFKTIKSFSKNKKSPEDYKPAEAKNLSNLLDNVEALVNRNRDFLTNYFEATVGQKLGKSNMMLSLDDFENRLSEERENLERIFVAHEIEDSLEDYKKEYSNIDKWIKSKKRRSTRNITQKVKDIAALKRKLNATARKASEYKFSGEGNIFQKINELERKVGLLNQGLSSIKKITSKQESMISKLIKLSKLAESLNDPAAMQPQEIPPPEENQPILDPQVSEPTTVSEPATAPVQAETTQQPAVEPPNDSVSVETSTDLEKKSSGDLTSRKVMTAVKKAVNGELKQLSQNIAHAIKWPEEAAKKAIKITTDKSARDILTKVKDNLKEDMNKTLSSIIAECAILEKKFAKAKEKEKAKKAKIAPKNKAKGKPKAKKMKKESVETGGTLSKFFAASQVILEAKKKKDVGKYLFKNRPSKVSKR